MRRSGAPPWAISLGLGTASESAARSIGTKVMAWTFWTGVLTCLFLGYGATVGDTVMSSQAIGSMLIISAIVVLGTAATTTAICRWKAIE